MRLSTDNKAYIIATLALLIAIASAALAWTAHERTGDNLDSRIDARLNRPASNLNSDEQDEALDANEPMETMTVPQSQP